MRLLGWQLRWEQVAFWRNPQSALFVFAFPIMFLVVFATLRQGDTLHEYGGVSYNTYLVPAILTFGLSSSCYTNIAIGITERRESGALKRLRGTPLPSWALVGGVLLNSLLIAVQLTALTLLVGMVGYGVHAPLRLLPLAVGLVLGAVALCALGLAVSTLVPNTEAAPPVVQFPFFLTAFISGVFFPVDPSGGLHQLASYLPLQPLVNLCFAAFDPRVHGSGLVGRDVLVLAAWAVGSTVVAVRRFRWEPRR